MSVFDSTAYLKFAKLQCFHWLSLLGGCGVAGGALFAEAAWCGLPSFLWVFSLLLGGLISGFCLASLRLVLCRVAAVGRLPVVQFIFCFGPLGSGVVF